MLLVQNCPPPLLPAVSALSFALTFLFARFPRERSQDAQSRSDLLRFYTDISTKMSPGLSAEAILSRKLAEGDPILASVEEPSIIRLMSGESADRVLRSVPRGSFKDDLKNIYLKVVRSGNADVTSIGPLLDLWAENLSLLVESQRYLDQISRRSEFLHYLISFTMGFLAASLPLLSRLRAPYLVEPSAWSPLLMFVNLFFLKSSVFIIGSRKFQFKRPLLKYAVGTLIMLASFLIFTNLFSAI